MEFLILWRFTVTLTAGVAMGLNSLLAYQWGRRWLRTRKVGYAYPAVMSLAAAFTGLASIYWRVVDSLVGRPFNPGDITLLIPSLGFGFAAILGFKSLIRGGKYDVTDD